MKQPHLGQGFGELRAELQQGGLFKGGQNLALLILSTQPTALPDKSLQSELVVGIVSSHV